MAEKEYRKLAGRGRRPGESFTWSTLWAGRDHFLQIEHTGYSEEYKRFYFSDVQCVTLGKTNRARNWSVFFVVMIVALASVALALTVSPLNGDLAIRYSLLGGIILFLLLLMVNWVKGPSCACHIQTAVQQDQLPSLKRIKKSRKVIAHMRELIASEQGILDADEARARFAAGEHTHGAVPPPLPGTPPPLP